MSDLSITPLSNAYDKRGFVYVLAMLTPMGEIFKIGKARNVASRLILFEPALPYETVLMFVIRAADALELESALHLWYAKYRLSGEWFALPDNALFELYDLASPEDPEISEWERQGLELLPVMRFRDRQETINIRRMNPFRPTLQNLGLRQGVERFRPLREREQVA